MKKSALLAVLVGHLLLNNRGFTEEGAWVVWDGYFNDAFCHLE